MRTRRAHVFWLETLLLISQIPIDMRVPCVLGLGYGMENSLALETGIELDLLRLVDRQMCPW